VAPGVESRSETTGTDSLETGSHDLPVSGALESYLRSGWGDAAPADVRVVAPAELCAARRRRLSELLPGERLVIPAGRGARRGNGQEVRYRAASDHVYLTGYEAEGAVLVLDDDGATLYLEPPSGRDGLEFYNDTARGELWVGSRPALDEVAPRLRSTCVRCPR
jgi:Xaa-Pro aminopeptidase